MDLFSGLSLDSTLNSFKTKTSDSMQTIKEATLPPVDVTTTRLKQGVATKTAKDTGVTGVITEYRSESVDAMDSVIGALSGGLLNTKSITKAIKVGKDGVTFSEDSLIASAGSSLGFSVSGQSGAVRKLASTISKEFGSLTGLSLPSIITSDGTGIRVNKNWRSQLGSQTLKTVGKMSGLGQYFDASVQTAVYNAVLKSAVEFGMSDSYKNLYDKYPSSLASAKRDAVLTALQTAITNGDVVSLNALIKLLDTTSRTAILAKYPTFVESLFSKFKFDDDVYPTQYPTLLALLLQILTDVVGENWWLKNTAFGDVLNLTIIHKASKDMITLLQTYEPVAPLLCCAGLYTVSSATVQLRSAFPDAPQYAY